MSKVSVFGGGVFLPIFVVFQKSTLKIDILPPVSEQKDTKNFLRGYYLVQVGVIIWSKLGAF